MVLNDQETENLLTRAGEDDRSALGHLLQKHRQQLTRLIAARIDRRLLVRLDPSDIVQEALADAGRKFPAYLRDRPMPYYPWLRRLALEKLFWWRRFHLQARKRDLTREEPRPEHPSAISDRSLVDNLVDSHPSPSEQAANQEETARACAALDILKPIDRRIIELRYFQGLRFADIAAELGIGQSAAKMRHLRALERFYAHLSVSDRESDR